MKNVLFLLPVPHFFSQCGGIGGHIAHADGILQALLDKGHQVDIVTGEKHAILDKERLSSHIVKRSQVFLWDRILWNDNLLKKITELSTVKSFDFCYCRYSFGFASWVGRLGKVLGGTKLVLEVNSFSSQRKKILSIIEKNAFVKADSLICVSNQIKHDLSNIFGSCIEHKTVVVPNGVNIHRFAESTKSCRKKKQPTRIGYVGVLKPAYGLETLIDAVRVLPKSQEIASLHIVGEGPYRKALERLADGVPNIKFHGACKFDEVPELLAGMDILVYPTTKANLFQSPIKIFEYMAARKPIVVAETPQTKVILEEGKSALFFPPEDVLCLAEKMLKFIECPEIAMSCAKLAHETVITHHSWEARLDKILTTISETLD